MILILINIKKCLNFLIQIMINLIQQEEENLNHQILK